MIVHQVQIKLFSLLAAISVGTQVLTASASEDERLTQMLFEEDVLEPAETLEILKNLDIKHNSKQTPMEKEWADLVKQYIGVSSISRKKCHRTPALELSTLLEADIESPSIDVYMKYYANKQFHLCKQWIAKSFRRAVKSLPVEKSYAISLLIESIVQVTANDSSSEDHGQTWPYSKEVLAYLDDISIGKLSEGVFLFMFRSYTIEEVNDSDDAFEPRLLFDRYVEDLCETISSGLDEMASIYEPFLAYGMAGHKDEWAWDWVTNVNVCKRILAHSDAVYKFVEEGWLVK